MDGEKALFQNLQELPKRKNGNVGHQRGHRVSGVMPSKRGRGVGSQALKLLAEIYPEQYIFLEIEPENEKASNALQRIRRKKFYLRCGFQETGILWDMYGVPMEVLCYQKQLTLNQCEKMYRYLYGRFWFLPIRRISHAHSQNSDIT